MQHYIGVATRAGSSGKALNFFMASFVAWWILLAVFNQFPWIDLAIADHFFSEANCSVLTHLQKSCGVFPLDKGIVFPTMRDVIYVVPFVAIVFLLGVVGHSWWTKGQAWKTEAVQASIAALVSLALGCGLIVNLLLKSFSGRPRPRDTLFFGGNLDFVQAGSFAGKCLKNCSFISGESSSAGWLFCLILLLPERWRLPVGLPLAIISIATPAMRVVMGAHYLSDAILGWLSSVVIFAGVLAVMESRSAYRQLAN